MTYAMLIFIVVSLLVGVWLYAHIVSRLLCF